MIDESKKQGYREIIIDLYNQPDKSSYDTLKLTKISFECVEKYKAIKNKEIEKLKKEIDKKIKEINEDIVSLENKKIGELLKKLFEAKLANDENLVLEIGQDFLKKYPERKEELDEFIKEVEKFINEKLIDKTSEKIKELENEITEINRQTETLNGLREKINSLIIEIDLKLNSKWYLEMQLGNLLRDNTNQINEFNAFVFENIIGKGKKEITNEEEQAGEVDEEVIRLSQNGINKSDNK